MSVCASADKEELNLLLTAGKRESARQRQRQRQRQTHSAFAWHAGADVNAKLDGQQEGAEGFTALMWAAYGGHKDIVELLISKGAGLEAKSDRCVCVYALICI